MKVMGSALLLMGALGACYTGFQFLLTAAYGLWDMALMYLLGLALSFGLGSGGFALLRR